MNCKNNHEFAEHASFWINKSLDNEKNKFSFESSSIPDSFLTVENNKMKLEKF